MQELVAWAGRLCEQQLKVPQGRTAWTGERVPRDGHLARSWRSSPWFQQLPGSLLHGPAASVCSAERRRSSAAHRSRTVDIVDIFLHRIDGNCSGMQEASCSAQAPSGCDRRPHGTSGGPGGPRGATSVVRGSLCVSVLYGLFSLYRRVFIYLILNRREHEHPKAVPHLFVILHEIALGQGSAHVHPRRAGLLVAALEPQVL